jgi:hypothetical protein
MLRQGVVGLERHLCLAALTAKERRRKKKRRKKKNERKRCWGSRGRSEMEKDSTMRCKKVVEAQEA